MSALQSKLEKVRASIPALAKHGSQTGNGDNKAAKPTKARPSRAKTPASDFPTDRKSQLKGSVGGFTRRPAAAQKPSATANLASRPVPLSKQVKDVLDCLLDSQRPVTVEELQQKTKHSLSPGSALYNQLLINDKVELVDNMLAYKSQHSIKNKSELLKFIKRAPEGIFATELKDSYRTISQDVDALVKERLIYRIHHVDLQVDVLFPVNEELKVDFDEELVKFYLEQEIPSNITDLQAKLMQTGLQPATKRIIRKIAAPMVTQKEKKKRQVRQRVVTNTHMPELFTGDQPMQID